eukprot:gene5581-7706_t
MSAPVLPEIYTGTNYDHENNKVSNANYIEPSKKKTKIRNIFDLIHRTTDNGYKLFNDSFSANREKLLYKEFEGRILSEQAKQHNNSDTLYFWVKNNDLLTLKEKLAAAPELIHQYDAAGANVVHLAYLFTHYEMGHYLVEHYPELALKPYASKVKFFPSSEEIAEEYPGFDLPYAGENLLHMVIIRRDLEEVRWLLDFYRDHRDSVQNGLVKLLSASVKGNFFSYDGEFYFGSKPFHFAVCSNSTAIFDLVLAFASAVDLNGLEGEEAPFHYSIKNHASFLDDNGSSAVQRSLGSDIIFQQDDRGNTALHLCVLRCLPDMYNHVLKTAKSIIRRELKLKYSDYVLKYGERAQGEFPLHDFGKELGPAYLPSPKLLRIPKKEMYDEWLEKESNIKIDDLLKLALNIDLHSPLTLAATLAADNTNPEAVFNPDLEKKQVEMLEFLVNDLQSTLWSYGPIQCTLVSLDGLEIKYCLDNYPSLTLKPNEIQNIKFFSTIHWLCETNAHDAIIIPTIRKVIQEKWKHCGRPKFVMSMVLSSITTTLVTFIMILFNQTPTTTPKYNSEVAVNFIYFILTAIYVFIIVLELPYVFKFGFDYWGVYGGIRGVAVFDRVCRWIKMITFLLFCFLKVFAVKQVNHYTNADGSFQPQHHLGVNLTLVICAFTSWIHMYYYLMGFESTGPFVLSITKIVASDVPYFMTFYSVILIAYACAFSIITNSGEPFANYGFQQFFTTLYGLLQITVSLSPTLNNLDVSNTSRNLQWIMEIQRTSFNFIVIIMMINILIAMVNSTYSNYMSNSQAILLIEKCNIMACMERGMSLLSDDVFLEYREKYCTIEYPHESNVDNMNSKMMSGDDDDNNSVTAWESKAQANPMGRKASVTTLPVKENPITIKSKKRLNAKHTLKLFEPIKDWGEDNDKGAASLQIATFMVDALNNKVSRNEEGSTTAQKLLNIFNSSNEKNRIKQKICLLIIDPQNDFHPEGSLAVTGANEDSERISKMIIENIDKISEIIVSMDSHYSNHIAHAIFWRNDAGEHPGVFTVITYEQIAKREWYPVDPDPELYEWTKHYTKVLRRKGRLTLTIWPEHCIIGSRGHAVVPVLHNALQLWAEKTNIPVRYVIKGQNLRTEMYSVIAAEVEDPLDGGTAVNTELMGILKMADKVIVCGEALSHCVNYTLRDIMDHWHDDMSRLVLLTDGASPVTSFEKDGEELIRYAGSKGVNISTTVNVFK